MKHVDTIGMGVSNLIPLDTQNYIACLRGFAILTILFGHVGGYWAYLPYSSYLHATGSTFFYFLSGAVLYHSYCRSRSVYVYMVKRFSSLLIPYYVICLVALVVYIANNSSLPAMDLGKLIDWILIQPRNEIMPFPLGQLWFLHTYILLFIISPLIFILFERSLFLIIFIYSIFLLISTCQYYSNLFLGGSLFSQKVYDLFFYSTFFTYGTVLYSGEIILKKTYKYFLIIIPIALFILINDRENIELSLLNKDILAISLTFIAAGIFFVAKDIILKFLLKFKIIFSFLKFYHLNTFSVYLLHTFSIYISENYFGLVNPPVKSVSYGLIKFIVVLTMCSLFAIPFTKFSKVVSQRIIDILVNSKLTHR